MITRVTGVTRERNPRGKGARLRVDLLNAAAELMAEHGTVEGVSLRAVAARAGVSPTAVYRHFEDHHELLRAAVAYCWSEFSRTLREGADTADEPFARFRAMGDAYVDFAVNEPGKYRVLFSNRLDVDGPDKADDGVDAFSMLVGGVAELLAANDDPRDPFFVATQVHTWIHGIVDLCANHSDLGWPSYDRLLDELGLRLELVPKAER